MEPLIGVHREARERERGFTLVEVLVVLLILGIAAAGAAVALRADDGAPLRREAQRLAQALEHAALLAQWRAQAIAWQAQPDGYRFLRRDAEGRWQRIDSEDALAEHHWPATTRAHLAARAGRVEEGTFLVFAPTGRNEPFELVIERDRRQAALFGDPLNRVRVQARP